MWRFVVVGFVALGWSFYVASGGSDYAPVENSIQVQGLPNRTAPEPAPQTNAATTSATASTQAPLERQTIAEVEATMARMGERQDETQEVALTLAQVNRDAMSIIQAEAERPKAELLTMELPPQLTTLPEPEPALSDADTGLAGSDEGIDAAIAAALGEAVATPETLRWVKETTVSLRTGPGLTFETVTRLSKGEEVAILEDPGNGWLNVQVVGGYSSGWVAEWLLMTPEE